MKLIFYILFILKLNFKYIIFLCYLTALVILYVTILTIFIKKRGKLEFN